MPELNESDFEAFEDDLQILVHTLKESFNAEDARYYVDERHDTLYVELEGLDEYSEAEITEIAGPVLDELDLDFDEIALLPLR